MGKLFEELKRRRVFRVLAVYAVVAWVLIQIADVVLPTFGAPEWVNQTIIFLFILGFLPTMIAAWTYEITPQGVRADSASSQPVTNPSNQKLVYATFALVLLVAGFQISDRFLSGAPRETVLTTESNGEFDRTSVSFRSNINIFYYTVPSGLEINHAYRSHST